MTHSVAFNPNINPDLNVALNVKGLAKSFHNVKALDNANFSAKTGAITGLLGGNGAGKTTAVAIIAGLTLPDKGHVTILGHDAIKNRNRIAHNINFESPYVDLPLRLTPKQNLAVYAALYNVPKPQKRISQLAEQLNLKDLLNRPTMELSAGQKTRVNLAKALVNKPKLLLLDEPTASLDPETALWVANLLAQYKNEENAAILLASHNMKEVERLCDEIVIMREGKVVLQGNPRHLPRQRNAYDLEDLFLKIARKDRQTLKENVAHATASDDAHAPASDVAHAPVSDAAHAPASDDAHAPDFSIAESRQRISAVLLRHIRLLQGSWPRVADMIYWPAVQLMMWGVMQTYLAKQTDSLILTGGALLGAVLLWDVLFRGQLGFTLSFLEEMYSKNLGHLAVSPLKPAELVTALILLGATRTLIGTLPASLVALWLFDFNLYAMGFWLIAFFLNLLAVGWAVGLAVCALLLRYGLGAENFAWSAMFVTLPLCCVYYPLDALPATLQPIALALPPTYVYEGMRSLLLNQTLDITLLIHAAALNAIYITLGATLFIRQWNAAKKRGGFIAFGE